MYLTIELRKLLSCLAILLALLIPAALYLQLRPSSPALETASWGLSFQHPGQAPIGNTTPEMLLPYNAKYIGDLQEKTIYLTFDCGYEAGYTAKILDVLQSHDVPAAFFVVGNYITSEPDLVRRMVQDGHIVGNHTWSHPDMSSITDADLFAQELRQVSDAFESCTGEAMSPYYRPPQGIYSQENLTMARDLGYYTVFWSLAYVDWDPNAQPTKEYALDKLSQRIHNGAVILLHNTSATNAAVLSELIETYLDMGYQFGTLDQLFER